MLSTFEEFKNKFQEFIDPEIILKEQAFLCDIKQDELKNRNCFVMIGGEKGF